MSAAFPAAAAVWESQPGSGAEQSYGFGLKVALKKKKTAGGKRPVGGTSAVLHLRLPEISGSLNGVLNEAGVKIERR